LLCKFLKKYEDASLTRPSYEIAVENILSATGKSKDSLTSGQTTGLNLVSGLIAGMAAAVISQPADTLLSKINKTKGLPGQGTTSRLISMSQQLGVGGLFTGMGARLVMIGTLTAGQCEFTYTLSFSSY
jgi:solute carrier family 25 phosphate transporter 3